MERSIECDGKNDDVITIELWMKMFDETVDGLFDGMLDGVFDGLFDGMFDGMFDSGSWVARTDFGLVPPPKRNDAWTE